MGEVKQEIGEALTILHSLKGPKGGSQALGKLRRFAYYVVDKDAEDIILDSAFLVSAEEGQVQLVFVSIEDLGLVPESVWDESIWYYGKICDKARELGFGMCTPNDVVQIALRSKELLKSTKGFIVPAMDPIVNNMGRFGILGLRLDRTDGKENFIIHGLVGHPRSSLEWFNPMFIFRKQPHPTFVCEKRIAQMQSEAVRRRANEIRGAQAKLKELDDILRSQLGALRNECAHKNGGNGGGAWGAGFCVDCGYDLDDSQW